MISQILFHRIDWWLTDQEGNKMEFKEIPEQVEKRIKSQINDGCHSGQLIESILLTEEDDEPILLNNNEEEPIECSGWWKITKD